MPKSGAIKRGLRSTCRHCGEDIEGAAVWGRRIGDRGEVLEGWWQDWAHTPTGSPWCESTTAEPPEDFTVDGARTG